MAPVRKSFKTGLASKQALKVKTVMGGSRFVRSKISSDNGKHFLNKTVLFKHYFFMSFHLNFASALDNKVIYIRPAHFSAANTNL